MLANKHILVPWWESLSSREWPGFIWREMFMVGTARVDTRIVLVWSVNESRRKWWNLLMTPDCFAWSYQGFLGSCFVVLEIVEGLGNMGQTRRTWKDGLCEVAGVHQGGCSPPRGTGVSRVWRVGQRTLWWKLKAVWWYLEARVM